MKKSIILVLSPLIFVLGVAIVLAKSNNPKPSHVYVVPERSCTDTDILVDESGTHGYIHGVWGFGCNLTERSHLMEQEPGCGIRIGNKNHKNIKVLTIGKLARIMEQERDTCDEDKESNHLLSNFPSLEKVEIEDGNPYLQIKQGKLYETEH